MTIEITKCTNENYWYYTEVGKRYLVDMQIEDCYKVWVGRATYVVKKCDCKVIEN